MALSPFEQNCPIVEHRVDFAYDDVSVYIAGLPADNIGGALEPASRGRYTSPTNVGGYLWSAVIARDLGLIGTHEAERRIGRTLDTLDRLRHNEPTGMFYNWYDPATGAVLHQFPTPGTDPTLPVQCGQWLAGCGLHDRALGGARPGGEQGAGPARRDGLRVYYSAAPPAQHNRGGGLMRGGFYDFEPVRDCAEARISGYIGFARGQVPHQWYFGPNRTFPAGCDLGWVEQRPDGVTRTYLGVAVFEGAYTYRGLRFVPSWGGDMFEALMPAMLVPEER